MHAASVSNGFYDKLAKIYIHYMDLQEVAKLVNPPAGMSNLGVTITDSIY